MRPCTMRATNSALCPTGSVLHAMPACNPCSRSDCYPCLRIVPFATAVPASRAHHDDRLPLIATPLTLALATCIVPPARAMIDLLQNAAHQLYDVEGIIRWGGLLMLVVIVFAETGLMIGF